MIGTWYFQNWLTNEPSQEALHLCLVAMKEQMEYICETRLHSHLGFFAQNTGTILCPDFISDVGYWSNF